VVPEGRKLIISGKSIVPSEMFQTQLLKDGRRCDKEVFYLVDKSNKYLMNTFRVIFLASLFVPKLRKFEKK